MEKTMFYITALIFSVWSQAAFSHGETEKRIMLEPELTSTSAGLITYKFQLVDTETNKLVGDSDLSVSHEKKLHLVVYDSSLSQIDGLSRNTVWRSTHTVF